MVNFSINLGVPPKGIIPVEMSVQLGACLKIKIQFNTNALCACTGVIYLR